MKSTTRFWMNEDRTICIQFRPESAPKYVWITVSFGWMPCLGAPETERAALEFAINTAKAYGLTETSLTAPTVSRSA